MLGASSFKRALNDNVENRTCVQGIKYVSNRTTEPLISTGVESLDELLGGGLPLGSLLILEEDRYTGYAHLLSNYYISQGLVHGHELVIVSADESPNEKLMQCPGLEVDEPKEVSSNETKKSTSHLSFHSTESSPFIHLDSEDQVNVNERIESQEKETPLIQEDEEVEEEEEEEDVNSAPKSFLISKVNQVDLEDTFMESEEKMKIAWRYQHLPKLSSQTIKAKKVSFQVASNSSSHSSPFCSKFLLTKKLSNSLIENATDRLHFLDLTQSEHPFEDLYLYLSDLLSRKKYLKRDTSSKDAKQVLRIAIFSFCSPFWKFKKSQSYQELHCLHRLKSLLHQSTASIFLTLSYTYSQPLPPLRKLSDFQFTLEAFSTSPRWMQSKLSLNSEYTGLFLPQKFTSFNSLCLMNSAHTYLSQTLAFSVRRKRFLIEPWHLPPDFSSSSTDDIASSTSKPPLPHSPSTFTALNNTNNNTTKKLHRSPACSSFKDF